MKAQLTPPAVLYNNNYAKKRNFFSLDIYNYFANNVVNSYKLGVKKMYFKCSNGTSASEIAKTVRQLFPYSGITKVTYNCDLKTVTITFNDNESRNEFIVLANTVIGQPKVSIDQIELEGADEEIVTESNSSNKTVGTIKKTPVLKNQTTDLIAGNIQKDSKEENQDEEENEESFFEKNKKLIIAAFGVLSVTILIVAIKK